MSVRLRLTLWYAAVLLLGLALFGGSIWFALERRLKEDVDAQLVHRVDGLQAVAQIEGDDSREQLKIEFDEFTREVPEGALIELHDNETGLLLPATGHALFPASVWSSPGYHSIVLRGRPVRVLIQTYQERGVNYSAAVAMGLEGVNATTRELRNLLAALVPAVLVIACLGGYWISRRALAPVDEITRVAKSISAQNLSSRLQVPHTGDELQRMSEAWNEVLERLEAALQRIRQFSADASHELRTPVALIRATAELALRRDRDSGAYRKALAEIQLHAERMTELTESLLALARADATGVELPLAPVDLNRVVAETVAEAAPLAEQKGVRLEARPAGKPATVNANDAGIRRLLLILIDNAVKYTPAQGTVTVAASETGQGIGLSVADSGIGIEPAVLPHIFERFYRADPARNANGGAGLGLPIAQIIARAHGTTIDVESAPGEGSTFQVRFRA